MVLEIDEVHRVFPETEALTARLERVRWPTGARCPYCGRRKCTQVHGELRHHCNRCNASFSVTTGTFLHGTRADLRRWLLAVGLVLFVDERMTSRAMAEKLLVNRNTACRMIRLIEVGRHTEPGLLACFCLILQEEGLA